MFPGPDEIEGFWALDKMHAPRPMHSAVVRPRDGHTLAEGFTKAQAEYDCPIMVTIKEINHYFYMAFHPHPDEAVRSQDRMTRYHDKLAEKVPGVGKRVGRGVEAAPYGPRTSSSRPPTTPASATPSWWPSSTSSPSRCATSGGSTATSTSCCCRAARFCDLYDKVMQPDDPTEAYQTLQGFHTRSVDASQGLWDLSRLAKASPALSELFDDEAPAELWPPLSTRPRRAATSGVRLDEYLYEFGWRSDAVYDLADVPWREDPPIPLASIAALHRPGRRRQTPRLLYRRAAAQRERAAGRAARAKLADDPDTLAKIDELYEAARYSFPLTEDHAFYIDQLGVGVFRRFVQRGRPPPGRQGRHRRCRRRLLPLPRRGASTPSPTAAIAAA